MADESSQDASPDYEQPPVVETVLGLQFDRIRKFRNGYLGAFWKSLDADEWPSIGDAHLLPTQSERFGEAGGWARGAEIQLTQDPACRLCIKNADGDRMIQVQNGRLHLNWIGKQAPNYPRYTRSIQPDFARVLIQFQEFLETEGFDPICPNQWEVTYVNEIPQGSVWTTPADWDFFRPLGSIPTIDSLIEGESFEGEWHFVIPHQRGRLHVRWQFGTSGREEDESDTSVVRLTLTARGPTVEHADVNQAILDGIDLGHDTIVRSFRDLMSDEANEFWGLKA